MSLSQTPSLPQGFYFGESTTSFHLNSTIMKKRKGFDFEPHFPPPQKSRKLDCDSYGTSSSTTMMDEDTNLTPSEERAVVPYDPSNLPLVRSPTSPPFTIVINSDFVPGLKVGTSKLDELGEDEVRRVKSFEVSKDRLAVIPLVASHSPMACEEMAPPVKAIPLELEGEVMEMDEPHINDNNGKAMEIEVQAAGAPSPWQQHCMMPNMWQKTTTPIRWC